jgi:hypothetical protein
MSCVIIRFCSVVSKYFGFTEVRNVLQFDMQCSFKFNILIRRAVKKYFHAPVRKLCCTSWLKNGIIVDYCSDERRFYEFCLNHHRVSPMIKLTCCRMSLFLKLKILTVLRLFCQFKRVTLFNLLASKTNSVPLVDFRLNHFKIFPMLHFFTTAIL